MPRSTSPIPRYAVLVAILLAVVVGWSLAWKVLAARADGELSRHIARIGERGTVFTCERRGTAGYPFRFEVECERPRLAVARLGNLDFSAERLRLVGMIWQPLKLVAFLDGPATIHDPQTGADYRAEWQSTEGSISFATLQVDRISTVFDGLVVTEAGSGDKPASLAARHLELHGRPAAGPDAGPNDLDIAVTTDGLVADDGNGRRSPQIAVSADVTARNVVDAAMSTRGQHDFMRRWQTADGALEIAAARLAIGDDVLANATGRLRLDEGGRLDGNLDANVAGLEKLLGPNGSVLATLGGAILGRQTEIEGRPARAARIRFDKGRISLGPLTVFELAPLY